MNSQSVTPPNEGLEEDASGSIRIMALSGRNCQAVALVILLMSGWCLIQWLTLYRGTFAPAAALEPGMPVYQVDINHSDWPEWTLIEGIGPVTARKIIEDRQQNGPFTSIENVARVKGIGKITLEKIKPFLSHRESD